MFARTERLTLRPPWPEDAPALAAAIGHEDVARMLARVPWPYGAQDAAAWVARPRAPDEPRFLIETHDGGTPRLVGGISVLVEADGPQLAYWLTPSAWGRGYATEAGRAVLDMARHALPIERLGAWWFADNPASGRVLAKLGFRETGRAARPSLARGGVAPAVTMELDLVEEATPPVPIAA